MQDYQRKGSTWTTETAPSEDDISEMLDGFIEAALCTSTDESNEQGGDPLDKNYTAEDIAPETVEKMRAVVSAFAKEQGAALAACMSYGACDWHLAGSDLWMTVTGQGCGFWDGDWPLRAGDKLTEAAKKIGEAAPAEMNLYIGDDGKIYTT